MKVDVDAVCCGLLEREDVDSDAVQDISGSTKKLDKVPTLLLIGFQYAGQHWDQLSLQTPTKRYRAIGKLLPNSKGPLEIVKPRVNRFLGILASHFTLLIIYPTLTINHGNSYADISHCTFLKPGITLLFVVSVSGKT